jgi:hypothetical protein
MKRPVPPYCERLIKANMVNVPFWNQLFNATRNPINNIAFEA